MLQVSGSWRSEDNEMPVFDLEPFLKGQLQDMPDLQAFCGRVAECLRDTGCVVVRDPRVGRADSEGFLDLMEQYFSQSDSAKLEDARPDIHYQVIRELQTVSRGKKHCTCMSNAFVLHGQGFIESL
jgi:hypothetical protein